ncbi:MAG TPA: hypothetical protein PKN04_15340 [bacterium]|nr:hypothetical protein [bacterium]HPG47234.1 hypothetical protein [bacterium]HPM99706.1 hypothetical protein [bacterium]
MLTFENYYAALYCYNHQGVYSQRMVTVDDKKTVAAELDEFLISSTQVFIENFWEIIDQEQYMGDLIDIYPYLDESLTPSGAVLKILEKEVGKSETDLMPYRKRKYWCFCRDMFDGLIASENSWFDIVIEGDLPSFLKNWFEYEQRILKYSSIKFNNIDSRIFSNNEDYELIGKLSIFSDINETDFERLKPFFFKMVDEYNDLNS